VAASTTPESLRYELKLACQEAAYERVRMALRLQGAAIDTAHPTRVVQSVYLDTLFGRALEENLAGISRREKLRFRWYGEEAGLVRGNLERKFRENALGWKEVYPLDADIQVEGAERDTFVEALSAAAPEAVRFRLRAGLGPVQWIRYQRDYLTTADGRVRVTLDTGLETYDQRVRSVLSRSSASPSPRLLIVEVKCAPEAYEDARQIVRCLPIPVDRCSKFVLASDPSHGPHPSIFSD
jgi:hypothetical protein